MLFGTYRADVINTEILPLLLKCIQTYIVGLSATGYKFARVVQINGKGKVLRQGIVSPLGSLGFSVDIPSSSYINNLPLAILSDLVSPEVTEDIYREHDNEIRTANSYLTNYGQKYKLGAKKIKKARRVKITTGLKKFFDPKVKESIYYKGYIQCIPLSTTNYRIQKLKANFLGHNIFAGNNLIDFHNYNLFYNSRQDPDWRYLSRSLNIYLKDSIFNNEIVEVKEILLNLMQAKKYSQDSYTAVKYIADVVLVTDESFFNIDLKPYQEENFVNVHKIFAREGIKATEKFSHTKALNYFINNLKEFYQKQNTNPLEVTSSSSRARVYTTLYQLFAHPNSEDNGKIQDIEEVKKLFVPVEFVELLKQKTIAQENLELEIDNSFLFTIRSPIINTILVGLEYHTTLFGNKLPEYKLITQGDIDVSEKLYLWGKNSEKFVVPEVEYIHKPKVVGKSKKVKVKKAKKSNSEGALDEQEAKALVVEQEVFHLEAEQTVGQVDNEASNEGILASNTESKEQAGLNEVHEEQATQSEVLEEQEIPSEVHQEQATLSEVLEEQETPSEVHEEQETSSEVNEEHATLSEVHQEQATSSKVHQEPVTLSEVQEEQVTSNEVNEVELAPTADSSESELALETASEEQKTTANEVELAAEDSEKKTSKKASAKQARKKAQAKKKKVDELPPQEPEVSEEPAPVQVADAVPTSEYLTDVQVFKELLGDEQAFQELLGNEQLEQESVLEKRDSLEVLENEHLAQDPVLEVEQNLQEQAPKKKRGRKKKEELTPEPLEEKPKTKRATKTNKEEVKEVNISEGEVLASTSLASKTRAKKVKGKSEKLERAEEKSKAIASDSSEQQERLLLTQKLSKSLVTKKEKVELEFNNMTDTYSNRFALDSDIPVTQDKKNKPSQAISLQKPQNEKVTWQQQVHTFDFMHGNVIIPIHSMQASLTIANEVSNQALTLESEQESTSLLQDLICLNPKKRDRLLTKGAIEDIFVDGTVSRSICPNTNETASYFSKFHLNPFDYDSSVLFTKENYLVQDNNDFVAAELLSEGYREKVEIALGEESKLNTYKSIFSAQERHQALQEFDKIINNRVPNITRETFISISNLNAFSIIDEVARRILSGKDFDSQVIFLIGKPGVGKSYLMSYFYEMLNQYGFPTQEFKHYMTNFQRVYAKCLERDLLEILSDDIMSNSVTVIDEFASLKRSISTKKFVFNLIKSIRQVKNKILVIVSSEPYENLFYNEDAVDEDLTHFKTYCDECLRVEIGLPDSKIREHFILKAMATGQVRQFSNEEINKIIAASEVRDFRSLKGFFVNEVSQKTFEKNLYDCFRYSELSFRCSPIEFISYICESQGLTIDDLANVTRGRELINFRNVLSFILSYYTDMSYDEISLLTGLKQRQTKRVIEKIQLSVLKADKKDVSYKLLIKIYDYLNDVIDKVLSGKDPNTVGEVQLSYPLIIPKVL
ncbi:hypothetical protein CJP74_06140 [Psittacicella melopsittaci]|uniref:Uncharacterized protein n=1 Tax=Psittacicella melopsittaci TaxID=2028576 RepID=A0A3A1Y3H4_9GAMM|nr:DnaA/Hda family protein [Psittacicella melopsittaci]RIY31859.1 hypothetical protein CJP74_06140 [Psittacicella melopsittaci]